MEAIAREVGKCASAVAYWVSKHELVSPHAARGPLDEALVRELVERGLSVRQIAAAVDRSATAVRHWLRVHELSTAPADRVPVADARGAAMRECRHHGWLVHTRDSEGYVRCPRCRSERVSDRRRRVKALLVAEAGGCCAICGYDAYAGALQFHHLDPDAKRFEIGGRGLTRAIDILRAEAAKCVLLCANCHVEVEAGVANLPPASENRSGVAHLRGSSTAEQSAVNR